MLGSNNVPNSDFEDLPAREKAGIRKNLLLLARNISLIDRGAYQLQQQYAQDSTLVGFSPQEITSLKALGQSWEMFRSEAIKHPTPGSRIPSTPVMCRLLTDAEDTTNLSMPRSENVASIGNLRSGFSKLNSIRIVSPERLNPAIGDLVKHSGIVYNELIFPRLPTIVQHLD